MSFHTRGADFESGRVHRRRDDGIEHVRPEDLMPRRGAGPEVEPVADEARSTPAHSTRASPAASPREDRAAARQAADDLGPTAPYKSWVLLEKPADIEMVE